MRLLIVSHSCAAAINQQLYAEVEQLANWKIDLVIPSNWRDEYGRLCKIDRWPAFAGQIIPVPVFRPGNIILHAYKTSFARLIRELNPDVIYMNHEPYALATAQLFFANRRTGNRPIGCYSCQNIAKRYPPPFRWTESTVLRSSRFAFPISRSVADVMRGKGYAACSTVLPLAVDPSVHYPRPESTALRKTVLESEDEVLLGYVGRLVPEKGLRTLLTALPRLQSKKWRLLLVGAGPMEDELKQLAARESIADRVIFTGFVPHIEAPKYLSAMDILVLPSETQPNWKEQFGRVLLEAMACGTPVLGSDSGEIPNLIEATGGGLVFRERNVEDLVRYVDRLIADAPLCASLAAAGKAAVLQRYSMANAAELFVKTIRSATGPGVG